MRLGLLDIGSTAARLELVDLDRSTLPRASWSFKARTQLAENTRSDGVVTQQGIDKAIQAVRKCMRAGEQRLPSSLVAYGTSAVRDATNGAELRDRLAKAIGIRIGVLSPHDEAALTYRAAHRWHGRPGAKLTTVDIGGGTTDVASGTKQHPDDVVSLPFGAARLTRQFLPDDPPRPEQISELVEAIRDRVHISLRQYSDVELGHPLAQSKVLRQLAVLTESTQSRLVRHPDQLVRANLEVWIPRLSRLDQAQRAALPGVSRSRSRRILAGAIVAETVLSTIGVETLEICPWGLREGLVFRFVEAYERAAGGARGDAVRAAMAEMFA